MEPSHTHRATSLVEARKVLLSRIPLSAMSHEVVAAQQLSFNDGLQCFHASEYDRALQLFHIANNVQENNMVLFAMSLSYYLKGDYKEARVYADRIDIAHCGPGCTPEPTDVDNLYLLIEAQAAGMEEQEDNYRLSGAVPKLYMPSDLLQHKEYYLQQLANIASTAHELNKKCQ